MIVQEKISQIVMLTNFVEKNISKCFDYLPEIVGEEKIFASSEKGNSIRVTTTDQTSMEDIEVFATISLLKIEIIASGNCLKIF